MKRYSDGPSCWQPPCPGAWRAKLHQATVAAPPPFANSVEQRAENRRVAKESRTCSRSRTRPPAPGEVKVIVTELPKPARPRPAGPVRGRTGARPAETEPAEPEPAEK